MFYMESSLFKEISNTKVQKDKNDQCENLWKLAYSKEKVCEKWFLFIIIRKSPISQVYVEDMGDLVRVISILEEKECFL